MRGDERVIFPRVAKERLHFQRQPFIRLSFQGSFEQGTGGDGKKMTMDERGVNYLEDCEV